MKAPYAPHADAHVAVVTSFREGWQDWYDTIAPDDAYPLTLIKHGGIVTAVGGIQAPSLTADAGVYVQVADIPAGFGDGRWNNTIPVTNNDGTELIGAVGPGGDGSVLFFVPSRDMVGEDVTVQVNSFWPAGV